MGSSEYQRVVARADAGIERLQQFLDFAVEIQHQLIEQGRIRAHIVPQ